MYVLLTAIAGSNPKFILIISQKRAHVTKAKDIWFKIAAIKFCRLSSCIFNVAMKIANRAAVTCVRKQLLANFINRIILSIDQFEGIIWVLDTETGNNYIHYRNDKNKY